MGIFDRIRGKREQQPAEVDATSSAAASAVSPSLDLDVSQRETLRDPSRTVNTEVTPGVSFRHEEQTRLYNPYEGTERARTFYLKLVYMSYAYTDRRGQPNASQRHAGFFLDRNGIFCIFQCGGNQVSDLVQVLAPLLTRRELLVHSSCQRSQSFYSRRKHWLERGAGVKTSHTTLVLDIWEVGNENQVAADTQYYPYPSHIYVCT